MIAKIRKGDGFAKLIGYLTKEERGHTLELHNLSSDTPSTAASEMAVAAAQSVRTTQPVMHISVSYAEDESPTQEQMKADGSRVWVALGLSRNQAVIIAHDDCDHQHFHIAANRVGPDGKTVSDSNSYAKIEATLRQIEVERSWSVVQGRHAPSPSTGQRKRGHGASKAAHQPNVPVGVKEALLTADSWKELRQQIGASGWNLAIVQNGKGSGALLIGPNGEKIGAGRVDRSATLTHLRRDPEPTKRTRQKNAKYGLKRAATATLYGATAPFLTPSFAFPRKSRRSPNYGPRSLSH